MHDVLVHYLEVNFPEIAEQRPPARAREPSHEERAAAAERLRELIRRLRRGTAEAGAAWHEPRASAAELIAGVNGELSPDERTVLDHFFELFARSMERTQAAKRPEPAAAEAPKESVAVPPSAPEAPPEPVAVTPSAPEAPSEPVAVTPAAPEAPSEPVAVTPPAAEGPSESIAVTPPAPELSPEPAPAATAAPPPEAPVEPEREPAVEPAAPEARTPPAPASAEVPAARLVPEQMAGYLQTILLAAAQPALDLLQVDASQVYTLGEQRRFVLRAGVPTESLAAPEGVASISSGLLRKALEHNEVFTVEDLATVELTPDEAA